MSGTVFRHGRTFSPMPKAYISKIWAEEKDRFNLKPIQMHRPCQNGISSSKSREGALLPDDPPEGDPPRSSGRS